MGTQEYPGIPMFPKPFTVPRDNTGFPWVPRDPHGYPGIPRNPQEYPGIPMVPKPRDPHGYPGIPWWFPNLFYIKYIFWFIVHGSVPDPPAGRNGSGTRPRGCPVGTPRPFWTGFGLVSKVRLYTARHPPTGHGHGAEPRLGRARWHPEAVLDGF